MNILSTSVPEWVSILFLLTISIPIFMIANLAKQGAINANLENQKIKWIYMTILIFYAIHFTYVSFMSFTGIFQENSIPPKIVLFTTIPLITFFLAVVSNLKIYKIILQNIALQSLVKLHVFRLIGVFFFILNAYGALPNKFAYVAGIGDMATAIASIFVAKAISNTKSYAKPLTIAWNIFGILDIVSVLTTAIITTKLSIDTGSQDVLEITRFPFCLIPAFAPATILFLHLTIFRKMWSERQ